MMRLNNIELRWSEINNAYELVKWFDDSALGASQQTCFVIAFFEKTSEGYDMRTVGERFFEDHDAWSIGKRAIRFLNTKFDLENEK